LPYQGKTNNREAKEEKEGKGKRTGNDGPLITRIAPNGNADYGARNLPAPQSPADIYSPLIRINFPS
jgi:hypothetical protein